MKKVIAIVLTLALLMMGAAFAETDAGDVEYVGEINVGTAFMLTGTYASVGVRAENAIKMVIDEVNANGGVQGYKINLISQDTSGDTDTAINAINLLVEDDVVAILGPSGSGKTTLLRIANFLETADGGEMNFEGEVLDGYLPPRKLTLLRA